MTFSQTSPAWALCEHPHCRSLESNSKDFCMFYCWNIIQLNPAVQEWRVQVICPPSPSNYNSKTGWLHVDLKILTSGMACGYLCLSSTLPATQSTNCVILGCLEPPVPNKLCLHHQPSSSDPLGLPHPARVLHMGSKLVSQGSTLLGRGAGRAGDTQGREATAKWKIIRKGKKKKGGE